MIIRKISFSDRTWIENLFIKEWASTRIVTKGKVYDANYLPGFIAEIENVKVGLITYRFEENECEVMSLNSLKSGLGIGKTLLQKVVDKAKHKNCSRIWLIATNDNIKAQKFYEDLGWELLKIHRNAIKESRKLKPEIPLLGFDGIPITDEYEYQFLLT